MRREGGIDRANRSAGIQRPRPDEPSVVRKSAVVGSVLSAPRGVLAAHGHSLERETRGAQLLDEHPGPAGQELRSRGLISRQLDEDSTRSAAKRDLDPAEIGMVESQAKRLELLSCAFENGAGDRDERSGEWRLRSGLGDLCRCRMQVEGVPRHDRRPEVGGRLEGLNEARSRSRSFVGEREVCPGVSWSDRITGGVRVRVGRVILSRSAPAVRLAVRLFRGGASVRKIGGGSLRRGLIARAG